MVKELQTYREDHANGEVSPSVLWGAWKAVMRGDDSHNSILKKGKTVLDKLKRLERQIGRANKSGN